MSFMPTPEEYINSLGHNPPGEPEDKKPRWRRVAKRVLVLLAILLAASLAYIAFNLTKLSVNPFNFGKLRGEGEGRVNVLLLGVGDSGHAGETLSDSNMVVSINTQTKQVAMISIPRDLRVRIPGYGYGKINTAHARGGIETAEEVVEDILDIPIHYYARANFSGLREAVDAVGGVEIEVQDSLYDPSYPCDANPNRQCGFKISKGRQKMDGITALKYARCRKGNCGDDFGRAMRQQEILKAVREKALSLGTILNPGKLNKLSNALGDNITTNLSINNIMRLANMLQDAQDDTINVVFSNSPGGFLSAGAGSDLVPLGGDFDDIQDFVHAIFKVGPIWEENPSIVIENGTTSVGIAGLLKADIEKEGYRITITRVSNALKRDYKISKIIDYTGGKKPKTASYLQRAVGVTPEQPATPTKYPPADFQIILGADYASKASTSTNQE